MNEPENIDVDEVDMIVDIVNAQLSEHGFSVVRAPSTLEEGLRDYALFGKFVFEECTASWFENADFIEDWLRFRAHPREDFTKIHTEFISFVKEEMGL